MARESHRPTKTNYQDYLFDFSNVDFSQYAGQDSARGADVAAQQTDEPGFLSRLGNTALAIGEGLTMLPGGIVDTVRDTWHGGDIDVTDTEAMREREERARQQAAYVQKYQGKAFDGVADAMISMPYSLATMGASLGAGIPATMAAGPVVGGTTGMAASGAVAYRASKQNFMENMLAETTKVLGRTPTQDEWDRIAQEFDSEAMQYGLWEAGPEALSNLFMAKLLGPLGKRVFSGGIGNAAKRVAGLYGEEMATETITQMGQGSIEADLGLRDEAPGVLQALGEVAPATFWQTTLMAGGKKGLDLISRRYGRGQQVEEAPAAGQNNSAPASDFGSLSGPEWNAPEARIDEAMWNREASARGWNHLRTDAPKPDPAFIPGDPFTDPAAAQDTEDFVRRFEEAEQAAEEDTAGLARSLDQGKTVDLLAPPPQQEDRPAPGLPSAPVKSAPAVHAPAPGPDIPRQTSPLLSPRDNDGIPAQPGQQVMAAPVFPVEPSPLPAGGVLSQMGQAGPQRQPPVTAVPTQAQVLNTQATPRADITAPAEALGMPAPDAIPREAQPAPQAGDMAAPSAMPAQQPVARPVVPTPEMTPMDAPRQEAPDASPRREEKPASVQAAPEVTAPLMYGGAPISRMPIGDDRRENQADSILQAAEQKAKATGDARMQAAVAEIQQERKYVGVTHDALWERINSDILPYAAEDAHDATQQPSPQDDFLRDHLVVATITGPAGSPTPPQSEGTPAKRQKSGTPSVAEQRKAILQSLPEDLRKAHKGAPLSKLKELAAQHGRNEESSPEDQLAANGTSYGTVDKPDTIALAHHFSAAFLTGRKFGTIVEARREAASLLGGAVRPVTETAKAVDEAIELGVTLAARKTVAEMRERGENDTAIYRAMVDLYQRQPRLSVRTSTSMAQQAYSTPAPIAFLASRLAGIDTDTKVFEPTAGNGMLLMEAAPKNTTANELNADRAARLRSQGFTVSEHDAVDYAPSGMDVVIANPPFGRVKDAGRQTKEFSVNGLTTEELDHAIVARALSSLKKDGRAVLIIGGKKGNDDSRSKKYRAADQVHFWGWLFEHYRVLDHFSVDGKLYERQGAGYPIDIVVLENSGPSRGRVFPGAALPRHYTSFGDLEEVLHGQVVDAAERTPGADGPDTGRVGDGPDSQSGRIDRAADAEIADADRGRVRSGRDAGTDGARSGKRLDPRVRDDRSAETGGGRILGSERPAGESGNDVSADAEGGRAGGTGQSDLAADGHRRDTGERRGRDDAGRVGELGDSGDVRPELGVSSPARQQKTGHKPAAAQKPKATEFQVAYEPASSMQSMGTLVPKNMATAARQALAGIEKRHGGIDQYVADQLGYPAAELGNYFAAEQVDALGMAISNIADGSGFIIGDQTGIGKGRVNAGIIRWAKRQGYIPVFVTMKPDLYADMVRDLADIGMEGFNPLPTNAGLSGSDAILLPDGRELKTKSAQAHEKILRDVMQNGMGAYDAVFTTYDQLNPVKGQDTFRRQFMMDIAPNAVFILDESHNAGGQASTRKKANAADDRAQFVRKMLQSSRQGTFYSSATYAKRPDVMSLYFKTDMQYAADDMGKLAEAIERGGIPMQQAVAAELTETGQYLRRERSFEGAEVQTSTVSINKDRAEKTADIMRAIMAFDDAKEAAVEAADKAAAKTGGSVGDNKSTGKGGASSTNFTAVMHNVIAQSLLAQKVDAVVEAAANDVARGEKVVIALSNTMGSMIKEFAEQKGIAVGSPINFTFNDMFVRYLEKSRMIAIKKAGQKKADTKRRLTDEELGPDGVQAYNNALAVIRNSDFGGLQVSVIDRMLAEFEARGIKADEITGRTERIDYTTDVPTYAKRATGPSDRIRVVDEFNSGKLDVVILNQAGSTGISLHSSERFKDQRRRNMIIAQAESNIDVFMQTLGRVFRTGQVVPPTYQLIMSDLPAEKRPAAVLAKKMSSLNANTTASKESDTSFKNIPDFLNKYGDRVAKQVMDENPELSKKLGSPVKEDGEDAMRKVTGRIPLLPVKEQEQLYALLESEYNDLIAQLEAMSGTGLEAKSLPLDARLLDEVEIVPAKDVGKDTPFAGAARIGTYDVKKLGKPWPSAKVKEMVQAADVPDTEKLFQEAQVWHNGKIRDMSDEAAANQQNRLNLARDVIADAARMRPGTPVLISGENLLMEGVMLRLYHKGSAENPLALSTWKMDIALPDASRKITIPLSQTVRKEDALTVTPSHRDPDVLYGMFDSAQRESREKAHIITGNILAAFQKVNGKGNVITFQDHEGNTIPGIMLPKDTDPQKLLDGMDVSLSPDAAIRFLRGLPGKAAVKTADKLLVLSHDGSDFTVSVPSSKAKGAQYFLNRDVLEAAGQDFIRSGQSMVLRHLSEGQAAGILQALSGQGYGFVADNNRDAARKIMADTDSQALASLASRPARRPDSLPSRFADMPLIEADSTQWFGPGKAIDADSLTETPEQAKTLREAVKAWARERFPNGTTATNVDTGWDVQITPKGVRDSLSHGFDALLARSVPFIPQIVESGIHLDSIEKKPGLISHIFANKIRLDGQDYVVGFVLREDGNGNRFYDHELTKIISSDQLVPGKQREATAELRTDQNLPPSSSELLMNRGDVMNILRERLGVNDGTGQVLFRVAGQFLPPKFKGRRAPSTEAVRRLADKMNSMAANAARVEIVENAGALPQNLRDAYASQADSVEGLYDPTTDTVWLVVENLESLERAAEVWLHENIVHHGLRSALAPAQRRLLLNQLWQIMGGMGNSSIRDIASRYGRDPRSNEADRLLIMEEALANLAERRARGMLRSTQEQSLWCRVVDAIVRAWNGMVHTLTGRRGRMGRSQMERLLDALQGHVMEGRPVAMPDAALEERTDSAGAFASLSADQQEAARAAWMQLQKDMEAWGRQVDAFQPENRPRGRQPKLMTVCSTPDVLQKLGAPALPMTMSADNLAKVLSDKQDHQLPKELVKQLPAALAAPVMVFESATTADSFVVLTELKHEGRSVMAAVHLDTERQRIRVNDIASAYRRGNEAWYLRQMEEGRLLYQDKKKSLAWARTNRLQLPRVRKLPARLSGKRILTEEDVVKSADPGRGGENTPLASLASRPSGLTESVASGIRALRKVMGRGVSADVEDILSNEEMGKLIPR
ncbi:MAG: strawberry notch C-terminal domain-containing protein, partial [Desulfovibrio piger]|uniref:MuF-C-terminal domain-containing protein n=1 Tax=Desulfovibrio piger TaxID=901 RepID=UPI00399A00AA